MSFGRGVLGRAVTLLNVWCAVSGIRLVEVQGAPLCVFVFWSCVRVDLLITMPSLVGVAAGVRGVVLWCMGEVFSRVSGDWAITYFLRPGVLLLCGLGVSYRRFCVSCTNK